MTWNIFKRLVIWITIFKTNKRRMGLQKPWARNPSRLWRQSFVSLAGVDRNMELRWFLMNVLSVRQSDPFWLVSRQDGIAYFKRDRSLYSADRNAKVLENWSRADRRSSELITIHCCMNNSCRLRLRWCYSRRGTDSRRSRPTLVNLSDLLPVLGVSWPRESSVDASIRNKSINTK